MATYASMTLRLYTCQDFKSDLEFRLTGITDKRMQNSWQMTAYVNLPQDDPRVLALAQEDKRLDFEQKRIETELKAVTQEIDAIQKAMEANIKKAHTWSAQG